MIVLSGKKGIVAKSFGDTKLILMICKKFLRGKISYYYLTKVFQNYFNLYRDLCVENI